MKIKITRQTTIPMVDAGRVFTVQSVTESHGETAYFIHHGGNYLAIRASECEVISEENPQFYSR